MAKGIFSGMVWGAVGGTAVLSVLSLYVPLNDASRHSAGAATLSDAEASEASGFEDASETSEVEPLANAVTQQADAPAVQSEAPQGARTDPLEGQALESTASAEPKRSSPSTPTLSDAPLEQEVQLARPDQPDDTTTPILNARAPEVPSVPTGDDGLLVPSVAVSSIDTATELASTAPLAVTQPAPGSAPNSDEPPVQPSAEPRVAELQEPETEINEAPTQEAANQRIVFPSFDSEGNDAEAESATASDTQAAPTVTQISSDKPITLQAPKAENQATGVVVNRLPSLATPKAEEAEVSDTATSAPVDLEGLGALQAFAANVDVTGASSMFAIVLVHTGEDGVAPADLADLDLPFSIAIDPSAPDAKEAAALYRAAGIEVLAMLNDLPKTSEPTDVAVAMEGYFGVLQEAVAVLDPLDARIQSNRALLEPVLDAIKQTGHGLVTYDKGLNTAQKTAARQNIAAATVFRLLDADLEPAPKIKRYLSRAAFTASQDGSVVVLGRAYPETVKALVEWALEGKAADMSMVPVSKIMLEDANAS